MNRFLPLLTVLCLLPLGCETGQDRPNTPAAATMQTISVSDDQDQSGTNHYETRAAVGSDVVVKLPFQAGTGYSWSLSSHSDGLSLVRMETQALKGNLPGGPMEAMFVLRVEKPTQQTARLELARPWEVDSAPARQVEIVIDGVATNASSK